MQLTFFLLAKENVYGMSNDLKWQEYESSLSLWGWSFQGRKCSLICPCILSVPTTLRCLALTHIALLGLWRHLQLWSDGFHQVPNTWMSEKLPLSTILVENNCFIFYFLFYWGYKTDKLPSAGHFRNPNKLSESLCNSEPHFQSGSLGQSCKFNLQYTNFPRPQPC